MPPDPRVHCGVAVYLPDWVARKVLLVKRVGEGEYASDGHGKWAMPGGWVDFGESLVETAIREVAEETGCTIEVDAFPLVTVSVMAENDEFQIVVPVFTGRVVEGEPRIMEPDKHSEVCWVPMEDIENLPLFGSTRVFLTRAGLA